LKATYLLAAMIAASSIVACNQADNDAFIIEKAKMQPSVDSTLLREEPWKDAKKVECLHAPWDSLDDNTVVRSFSTESDVFFRYDVPDTSLCAVTDYAKEEDILPEDRVEVFFSPTSGMDSYYCAEIDPNGHALDYSAKYYRKMDYGWNFSSLKTITETRKDSYTVIAIFSKKEIEDLGVDLSKGFYMGIFRADFRPDGSVNWYSLKGTDDKSPDFHKPAVLFKTIIK